MRVRCLSAALVLWFGVSSAALAQFKETSEDPKGPRIGTSATQRWQAGLVVTAEGGPCRGLVGTATIPIQWPEQEVRTLEEDVTPTARVSYQSAEGTLKVMVVKVPSLPGGQQAKALVTLEVKRSTLLPPKNTEIYKLPDPKRLPRDVRPFLGSSPLIESRNPRLKTLAKQIMGEKEGAWEKVEAICQWVRQNVKLKGGRLKGAALALKDGEGNHEDLASLFIALCRAADIPARTVWVPKYCYPEFYLLDDDGKGHWFPCRVADNKDLGTEGGPTSGKEEFGGISETGLIIAKGDNFRSPHTPRERLRFPAETLTAESGTPKVEPVRKPLP